MLKNEIESWTNEKIYHPKDIKEAYIKFCKETGISVSQSHFYNIFSNLTRIQTIKTGGVYTRSSQFIDTIVQRSFYGITMHNIISIDEKPIIIKNYKQTTIRTDTKHKGKVPSNKIKSFKSLDNIKNVYLLCAITCNSVFLFHLSDEPIDTLKFNAFLSKLCSRISNDNEYCFFLIDNASFHTISETIHETMKEKKVSLTRTPPMGCFMNPIEEFFACFDFYLRKLINKHLIESDDFLTQEQFLYYIHKSIKMAVNMNLKQIFRRAGLLEE